MCHGGLGGEISASSNGVEHRTGLNSRKCFQITKSTARQQGCSGGPTRGLFEASPRAGDGFQLAALNSLLFQLFLLAKAPCSFQQKEFPRKGCLTQGEFKNVNAALSHAEDGCVEGGCTSIHVGAQSLSCLIRFSMCQVQDSSLGACCNYRKVIQRKLR